VAEGALHEAAKREHLKRLIAGRREGVHNLSPAKIREIVGTNARNYGITNSNLTRARNRGGHHGFEQHHLKEAAHEDVSHPSYNQHRAGAPTSRTPEQPESSSSTPAPQERPQRRSRRRSTRQEAPTQTNENEQTGQEAPARSNESEQQAVEESPEDRERKKELSKILEELSSGHGVDLKRESSLASDIRAVKLAESNPNSEQSRALSEADPDFARSEAIVRRAIETQANGGNPYLERATEIFGRIKDDLTEERSKSISHMMSAINSLKAQESTGALLSKADKMKILKRHYNEEREAGDPPFSKAKDHFERGTFHTVDEVLDNDPIDPEVERFVRGYAAKQMARLRPYLKPSWVDAHSENEVPTFGDLVSLRELATMDPEQAASIREINPRGRAGVPLELQQMTIGSNGKPQLPPEWLPINLFPVWVYTVKQRGEGSYGGVSPGQRVTGSHVDLGAQSSYGESHILRALRKYVQMRGGPGNLIDIPAGKLSQIGLTHADIFKGERQLSDEQLKKLIKTKIIDPVALTKIMMDEAPVSTSKSFSLYIDSDAKYVPGEIIRKSEGIFIDLRKSKIEKIEHILQARRA